MKRKADIENREQGFRLFWQPVDDEMLLEQRWGMSFTPSLADLESRSQWVGPSPGGYWRTPLGDKMRTFGDLRRLMDQAYPKGWSKNALRRY